jgi:hypothetical protein
MIQSLRVKPRLWALLAGIATLLGTAVGQAQVVGTPLEPSGVGSGRELGPYSDRTGGGALGGPSQRGMRNPADTLLRELNGTNNGRRRGQAAFRGRPVREAERYERTAGQATRLDQGTVMFRTRGEYEDVLYGARRGAYRVATRSRTRPARPSAARTAPAAPRRGS